jgi:nucleotide-binding universal stress UspA family protein
MYETIVWATDGSEGADAALAEARRLAEDGTRIFAVHCDQLLNGRAGGWSALVDEDDRRMRIRRQIDALRREGLEIELVIRRSHQEAADTVAALAEELGADVIVCGTRGRGGLSAMFLGSVAQRLLQIAAIPVLVVPERTAKRREAEASVLVAPALREGGVS